MFKEAINLDALKEIYRELGSSIDYIEEYGHVSGHLEDEQEVEKTSKEIIAIFKDANYRLDEATELVAKWMEL